MLRSQLEAEGVGVASTTTDPPPVIISPVQERLAYDIAIPITKPSLEHDVRKLPELKVEALDAIYEQEDLAEASRVKLRLEFATTETEVHQADIAAGELPRLPSREPVAAVSCGVVEGTALLDLDYAEDSIAQADGNFVLSASGGVVEIQLTAEDLPLSDHHVAALRALAQEGIARLVALQREAIARL